MNDDLPPVDSTPAPNFPRYILAPFVPTPPEVVEEMLELAGVSREDVVFDLGCGDGRIVIAAAVNYGARGVGVDYEPYYIQQSIENSRQAGVEDLVTFVQGDALSANLETATVVTMYLVEWSTAQVQAWIAANVRPGTRIVSHNFELTGDSVRRSEVKDATGAPHRLYLWITGQTGALSTG